MGLFKQRGFVLVNPFWFAPTRATNGFVFFAGGVNGADTTAVSTSEKYTMSGDTSAASTALSGTRGSCRGTATGGSTGSGYIAGGDNTSAPLTTVDKFAWSSMTRSAGTVLNKARSDPGNVGNVNKGIFCADGWTGEVSPMTTTKYTYSGDTVAAGPTLSSGSTITAAAAVGNGTNGYIDLQDTNFGKYVFSTDTLATTSIAGVSGTMDARCGTTSTTADGYFGGSSTGTTAVKKLNFSGETTSNGTALNATRIKCGAAGNSTKGIFAGGHDGSGNMISTTGKYTYSGDTTAAGGALSANHGWHAGASADPGGFVE